MIIDQRALLFHCAGSALVGVADVPERPLLRGVLLLADASQYRIGARREATLLSRSLATRGIPVLRFDRRGSGDAGGAPGAVAEWREDIQAAVKESFMQAPDMKELVIWSFGDAAAAAVLHADAVRACGLVLYNPALPDDAGAGTPALAASLACFAGPVLILTAGADARVDAFLSLLERYRLACERIDLLPGRWRDDAASAGANWLMGW